MHIRPETTGTRAVPALPHGRDQLVKQLSACIGGSSAAEARPVPLARISGERELRHKQHSAVNLRHIQVHLAVGVSEYPIIEQAFRKPVSLRASVALLNANQYKQAGIYAGDAIIANLHTRPAYSLQKTKLKDTSEAYTYVLNNLDLNTKEVNIASFHDYFAKKPDEIITSDSERELVLGGQYYIYSDILEKFDYVGLGHLHNPQKVGTDYIRYSGSPLKYSFGEKAKKSVPIYDTLTKEVEIFPLKPLRNMITISGSLNEVLNKEFYSKYNYKTDFFRIKLVNTKEIDMLYARLKEVYSNLMEIENVQISSNVNTDKTKKYKNVTKAIDDFYKDICDYELTQNDYKLLNKVIGGLGYENK